MRLSRVMLIMVLSPMLFGCAVLQEAKDIASKKETVAVCKTVDVVSTIAALNTGAFHETNPIMKALMGGAHGFAPFIAVSVLYIGVVWWLDNPTVNLVSSAVTCPVALRNVVLIAK